ncbi:glycosyltransferase [Candidatus Williamhamiltonella defendens]|uniref:glycosyltransferase n=1 Tax=Candidatus Williamhamiltonella defendens TaxID=138072 RepID=UPI00165112E1
MIVPVFNEQDALPVFYHTVSDFQPLFRYEIEIIFITDSSRDKTSHIIGTLSLADPIITLINFLRNFRKKRLFLQS